MNDLLIVIMTLNLYSIAVMLMIRLQFFVRLLILQIFSITLIININFKNLQSNLKITEVFHLLALQRLEIIILSLQVFTISLL